MDTKENKAGKTKGDRVKRPDDLLTVREREVIERAATGAVDKEISRDLGLQPSTLNGYWKHVRLKLGVSTRTEAVAKYLQATTTEAMEEREGLRSQVTELKSKTEELQSREAGFRSLLRSLPIGLMSMDDTGKIHYCNPRFADLMCLPMSDILGRTIQSLVDPSAAAVIRRKVNLRNKGVTSHYDLKVVLRNGKTAWLRFSGAPLFEGGKVTGIVAAVDDVTERKRLESDLRLALDESLRRGKALEAIFEVAPVGVVVFDAEGNPTRISGRIRELFGLPWDRLPTREEWLAVPCYRRYPDRKMPERLRMCRRLLGGEDRIEEDRAVVDLPGSGPLCIQSSGVALKNHAGEVLGAIQVAVECVEQL